MRTNTPVTGKEQKFDQSANLLSTTNLKGQIKYANTEFCDIAGFSQEDLVGQPHNVVRHPDMPPKAFEMLWDRLKQGKSWMGLVKNRCSNGDHYWVDAYATPIQQNGENIEYQSVRVSPKREYVDRAEALYKKINAGKIPGFLKGRSPSTFTKLSAAIWIALAFGCGLATLLSAVPIVATAITFFCSGAILQASLWRLWKPMAEAISAAAEVTDDPVAMHVYTGRNDDAGQIKLALKMLGADTGGLVGRIADDSRQLSTQSQSLLESVELSNNHVNAMHHQTDQVATAINEMSATVQEVATNASAAADAANDAHQGAESGRRQVQQTANTIGNLASEIDHTSQVISQLEKDCDGINTIVDVIRSVAEQTNLLALNAAIEAARAGEQGRGFAVVADEVRTLATRTHDSTAEITQMIEKLQQGSRAAVESMGQAQNQTESCVSEAQNTAETIDQVTASIDTITEMNQQIATAVEEQSAVAEDINQNITSVSQLAEELHQLSDQNAQTGTKVNTLAVSLKEMAQQFFLKRH